MTTQEEVEEQHPDAMNVGEEDEDAMYGPIPIAKLEVSVDEQNDYKVTTNRCKTGKWDYQW